MKLKEIEFGSVDAKNEIIDGTDEQKDKFKKAFLLPENVNLKDFIEGRKYYLVGMKGTGKTALLRYIGLRLNEDNDLNNTMVILFKSNFDENSRKEFNQRAVETDVIDKKDLIGTEIGRDFENSWEWYFFRYIYLYTKKNKQLFDDNDDWKMFCAYVDSIDLDDNSKYFPKIRQGKVTLNIKIMKADFDISFGEDHKVKFVDLMQTTRKYFIKLKPLKQEKLFLLIDELELEYSLKKNYERDSRIIRDLVVVVNKLNQFFRKNEFPIYCIASIRSEVLTSVNSIGKEINKRVEDFGTLISWHQAGGNEKEHPLIRIIKKRLIVAEKIEETEENLDKVWDHYFPDKNIQSQRLERYILHNTWYRPRDIVRLLNIAKDVFPQSETFSHQVLDGIRKTYSQKSWTECLEELNTHYNKMELDAIGNIFSGWKSRFSLEEFKNHVHKLAEYDSTIKKITDDKILDLLNHLYSMGIIGNFYKEGDSERKTRFVFRGDEKLFPSKDMRLHAALKPYFSSER